MLVPLDIPPGLYRNGTDLEASGRWRDGSLVRWHEGVMQPVKGWRHRVSGSTRLTSTARAAKGWQDNTGDRWVAFGSHDALRILSASGTIYNITPSGFTVGLEDAEVNTGYSGSYYGTGFYGVTRPDLGNFSEVAMWSLSLWGENLLGCCTSDGKIYEWELSTGSPATAVANAPTGCLGVHVTAERFVFAIGAGNNPRMVQWSDREDHEEWTPAITNEAGSFQIETDGQLMAAVSVRGQTLLVTDTEAHVANYVGPPYAYGFERVGQNCGVISRKAIAEIEGGAIWMGQRGFYRYFGGAVEPISCDVSDFVFGGMNPSQRSKIHAIRNSQFNEVWWFYPPDDETECARYVAYNYREGHWTFGELNRTCGIDRGVFTQPIWSHSYGYIYDQETGNNYFDREVFAETGPLSLGGGEVFSAKQLLPDELTQGGVTAEFKTRFYPNGEERTYGPYTMGTPTDVRFTGRQARLKITGARLEPWRWGIPRIRISKRGKR